MKRKIANKTYITLGGKRDFTKQKNIGILKLQDCFLRKYEKDGNYAEGDGYD